MKKRLYKRMMAIAVAAALAGMPAMDAFADNLDVPETGDLTREVVGSFTVTDADLADMGYGPMVSVPLSMSLSYNSSSKAYKGNSTVYAYGIMGSGKKIGVTIDTDDEKYGKIYSPSDADVTKTGTIDFSCVLNKTSWTASECRGNLEQVNAGSAVTSAGTLAVSVSKDRFLPSSTGTYKTYIPLVIAMGEV